jgi:hypothetical protein
MMAGPPKIEGKHGIADSRLFRVGWYRFGKLVEQKDSAAVEKWRPYVCELARGLRIGLLQSGPAVPLGPQ